MSLAEKIHEGLRKHVEKSKSKEKSKKSSSKVSRFEVEPAEGGYSVKTHFNHSGNYEEPQHSVHKTLASVHKHMREHMDEGNENDEDENDTARVAGSIKTNKSAVNNDEA